MKEELITYDTAVLAKDKGFDIPCLYGVMGKKMKLTHEEPYNLVNWNAPRKKFTSVPTQSLLQKWLREKHSIEVEVTKLTKYYYKTYKGDLNPYTSNKAIPSDTYEEAWEKGLQEALKLV